MPEIANNAQVALLHTILGAVDKYCVDLKGIKEQNDGFQKQKSYLLTESDNKQNRNSMSSTLFDYLNEPSKKRDSISSHLVDHLNEDNNNVQSLIKLLGTQQKKAETRKYKDDLAGSWETLSDFDEYQRNSDEDIVDYVSKFDKKYQMLVLRGITLSPEVLALKVLNKARLNNHERMLIEKGIDFSRKDGEYEEAKQALVRLGEYQSLKKSFRNLRREQSDQNCVPGRFYLILDSACSSTLCGKKWFDDYLDYLGEEMNDEVEYAKGEKTYIFGGGEPVKSLACCRIPAFLAGKRVSIEVDVVPNDLPLIYSLGDMKKAQIKLDFTNDTAEIFGQIINLKITESGHYSVPVDGVTFRKRKGLRQLSQEIQMLQDLVTGV